MRKFVAVFLLLSLCLLAVPSLRAQTRPRRVTQSTGAPPPDAPPAQTNQGRPPVLRGNVSTGQPRAPQTPDPVNEGPEEVGDGDIVRVETALVTIPVSVTDREGRYAPDLRQEDFRIYEDGTEQEVAYFASVEKPFTVALVLDTSGSTKSRMDEIQDAAIAFVNQLRPDDRVMVIAFDDDIHVLAEATSDRYTLRNAIRRAQTGDGTSLYDAVDFVINQRFNRINGRKAIVLFTDGVDTTSRRANYQSTLYDAEELDALIYPVQYDTYRDNASSGSGQWPAPTRRRNKKTSVLEAIIGIMAGDINGSIGNGGGGGGGSSRGEYEYADRYLGDLAQRTGARRYHADSTRNLEGSFALVAEELRRQYSLGYYPRVVAQAGQRRQIKVRVNRPNLIVRARDSYISNASTAGTDAQNQQGHPFANVGRGRQLARTTASTPF